MSKQELMIVTPSMFDDLKKDNVENRIIRAMISGEKKLIFDNSENNIGRCKDENRADSEIAKSLLVRGFKVSKLFYEDGDREETVGYMVRWGSEDE